MKPETDDLCPFCGEPLAVHLAEAGIAEADLQSVEVAA